MAAAAAKTQLKRNQDRVRGLVGFRSGVLSFLQVASLHTEGRKEEKWGSLLCRVGFPPQPAAEAAAKGKQEAHQISGQASKKRRRGGGKD